MNSKFTLADIKKNKIKKILREEAGFKTIAQAKKVYDIQTAEGAYIILLENHNFLIDLLEEKELNVMINVIVHIQFKSKNTYPNEQSLEAIKDGSKTENIIDESYEYFVREINKQKVIKPSNIKNYIQKYNLEDSVKFQVVADYNYQVLPDLPAPIPAVKEKMKNAFILKNDWLAYSKGISKTAYEETNNNCVYYQISKYLLNENGGRRPTKFIERVRTSEECLYEFWKCENEPNYEKEEGVSTDMIMRLCNTIGRNMYAYDEDNKCFESITKFSSKNYAPIVFYKMNGHMYLIDDPKVIRSVAESNKSNVKKIISNTVDINENNNKNMTVFHIESFPMDTIHLLKSGIYILQQSNLSSETIKYIFKYKNIPKTKNRENVVIQMTVINDDEEEVCIAVDANYSQNIDYNQLKNVAETNHISYINEGIGSVINNILKGVDRRKTLTVCEKDQLVKSQNNACNICKLECKKYQYDHIIALANGGNNEMENLQALCIDCHKEKTLMENEMGYKKNDSLESCFNEEVMNKIINTPHFKTYQFVECVKPNDNQTDEFKHNIFKHDIKKCRRNIGLNCEYKFPVYSVMDTPAIYNGEDIKCGFYYIDTSNAYPFRGSGWYCEPLVLYGLQNNMINKNNIQLEFIPSFTKPKTYLKDKINTLLKAFECEPTLQKLAVNAYIGCLGQTKKSSSHSKYSLSVNTASNWYVGADANKQVFIKSHNQANNILYEGIFNQKIKTETTAYPIYSMILQMEAVELHKLETIIHKKGGRILDRNTDAIRYSSKKVIQLDEYLWDIDTPKYQVENAKPLKIEHLPHYRRETVNQLIEYNWNITYDYINIDETINHILDSEKSIHIDGEAGTGKTYFANKLIENLKSRGKKYIPLAPTNKAARLINGTTIHSLYNKFHHSKPKLIKTLTQLDYILIDEISMMPEQFYKLFLLCKQMCSHLKFILVGDFSQLLPVKDEWTGDYKNSCATYILCDGNRIQLTKCRRADNILYNLCKKVQHEDIDISQFPVKQETYKNIAYTHTTRIEVNKKCMEKFVKAKTFISIPRNENNPKTQDVKLCIGMPIISHINDKKKNILNNTTYTIKQINDENMIISDDINEIELKTQDFHKYFYVAFCITIHSSQGETFNMPYTIYDWKHFCFCRRAKYVALSRATNIQNIQIQ